MTRVHPLRLARVSQGVTQFEIARRARLASSRLSLLERGLVEPFPAERASLARALGKREDELFPAQVETAAPVPVEDGAQNPSSAKAGHP